MARRWRTLATADDEAHRGSPLHRASLEGSRDRSPLDLHPRPGAGSPPSRLRQFSGRLRPVRVGSRPWNGVQSSSRRRSTGSPKGHQPERGPVGRGDRRRRARRASTPARPSCTTTSTCYGDPRRRRRRLPRGAGGRCSRPGPTRSSTRRSTSGPTALTYDHLAPAGRSRGSCGSGLCDPGSVNLGGVDDDGVPARRLRLRQQLRLDRPPVRPGHRRAGLGPSLAIYEPGFLRPPLAHWRAGTPAAGHDGQVLPLDRPRLHGRAVRPPATRAALDAYLELLGDCPVPWAVSVVGRRRRRHRRGRVRALERGGHLHLGLEFFAGDRTPVQRRADRRGGGGVRPARACPWPAPTRPPRSSTCLAAEPPRT